MSIVLGSLLYKYVENTAATIMKTNKKTKIQLKKYILDWSFFFHPFI